MFLAEVFLVMIFGLFVYWIVSWFSKLLEAQKKTTQPETTAKETAKSAATNEFRYKVFPSRITSGPAVSGSSSPSPAAISGAFSTPLETYGEDRLSRAYWTVLGELQGDGLTPDMLNDLRPSFIAKLGDSRGAGKLLAEALGSVDWDWPRWQPFAKREGCDTVSDVREAHGEKDLRSLLEGTVKDDLVALAGTFGIQIKKSVKKSEMIDRLMAVPTKELEPWLTEARNRIRKLALWKVHCMMGHRIASRVNHLAHEELRHEQISDPDFQKLFPYWQFHCDEHHLSTRAPKKCRDLDQVMLPAAKARKVFPKLPCSRLDCHCRISAQREPRDGDQSQ